MKKVILIVLTYLLFTSVSVAQYYQAPTAFGNPNNVNQEDLEYPVSGGLPTSWSILDSGNAIYPRWSAIDTLPFAFNFNGNPVTVFKVSTSGVLTFNTNATAVPGLINQALPHASIPDASICIWGLSGRGSNDFIVTKTFGTAPHRQLWVSFNAYSLPSTVGSHHTYWSIVLEETTNAIYIVDQRSSPGLTMGLTLGMQLSSTNAVMITGSPAATNQSADSPTRADNVYHSFYAGTQPLVDADGLAVLLADYLTVADGPYEIQLVLRNLGADTISFLDMNYIQSGNLKTSATISNLSIAPWETDTVSHPQLWAPQTGVGVVKVWAENINGMLDTNTANDTAFKAVTVIQSSALRVPLLETFTSSTSITSKTFNTQFENTLAQYSGDVVHVKYAMSWPGNGDPYFTNEGSTRRQYYGVSSVPNLQVDGTDWTTFNTIFDQSVLTSAQNKLALIDLAATSEVVGQTVCVDIDLTSLVDMPNADLTLYAAIYENESVQNIKNNGETVFYNVMKKMLPNANGTSITALQAGATEDYNLCFTFKGNYVLPPNATQPINLSSNHTIEDFENLGVAAWVQNNQTKEVLQAVSVQSIYNDIGLGEYGNARKVQLYPNPADQLVYLSFNLQAQTNVRVRLTTITGKSVLEKDYSNDAGDHVLPVALPDLPAGMYLISIAFNGEEIVQKIMIE